MGIHGGNFYKASVWSNDPEAHGNKLCRQILTLKLSGAWRVTMSLEVVLDSASLAGSPGRCYTFCPFAVALIMLTDTCLSLVYSTFMHTYLFIGDYTDASQYIVDPFSVYWPALILERGFSRFALPSRVRSHLSFAPIISHSCASFTNQHALRGTAHWCSPQ